MRTLAGLLVALVLVVAGGSLRAQLVDERDQLSKLERHCAEALVNGDVQWLATFYDPQWLLVGSDGRLYSRQQTLALLGRGDLQWISCDLSDMHIRLFGDFAVVVYRSTALGAANGEKIDETEVCTDAFVRTGDTWRCVHSHNTRLP